MKSLPSKTLPLKRRGLFRILVLIFSFTGFNAALHAQSGNADAINFFNQGLQEKNQQIKLELYQQAIELDPEFVEANYNIGLIYKLSKGFEKAESYLIKARDSKQPNVPDKLKTRILYNLGLIQKLLGKLDESEKTLIAARSSNKNRTLGSQITFELGRIYHERKQYSQALATLMEGQKEYKENSSFFENLIQIIRNEQKVDGLEIELQKMMAAQDYVQAQSLVQQIKTLNPSYAGLAEKSALIDSLIAQKAKQKFLKDMYELADQSVAAGDLEKAVNTYELLLQNDTNNVGIKQKLADIKGDYQEQQTTRVVEEAYGAGIEALQAENWTRAIISFEKVIELNPDYIDAKSRLAQANRSLESEGTESIVRQYYIDGVAAMSRKDLNAALASFQKVYELNPSYKDTRELIDEIKNSQAKSGVPANMAADEYFKSLYDQAVTAMSEEDWMQAVLTLEKLRYLAPNDHNVLNLLIQSKENLKLSRNPDDVKTADMGGYRSLIYIGSALFAIIVLPFVGYLVFSPMSRARIYYLRGNYFKAAQLYERILAKHPERLKLYPTLANIYLMLGRNDERALRVFKMLIDLNLAKHIHPQINSMMSQKYLGDGNHEDEAIAILENELKAEQENNSANNAA